MDLDPDAVSDPPDSDPDPVAFAIGLQDTNRKQFF
jgi:hypothetical protein